MLVNRRRVLAWLGAAPLTAVPSRGEAAPSKGGASPANAPATPQEAPPAEASSPLRRIELDLQGDPKLAQRALLMVPAELRAGQKLPLVVLLHGLGETGNPRLGLKAWSELYGLVESYRRLSAPPLGRVSKKLPYFTEQRQAELNRELAERPFQGLALVCPVTPNPFKAPSSARCLDDYASWIAGTLLPAVRERAPVVESVGAVGVDGCSLGGYVAWEVFLRKPELFGCVGSVQGAFSAARARGYAERCRAVIERHGPRRVHVESSTDDPYRGAAEALGRALKEQGVPHDLIIPPGPHNQPWLREIGTLEMLLWYDRHLARST